METEDDEEPAEGDDADDAGDADEGDDESPLKKALAKVRPVYTQAIKFLKAQPRRLKASEVKKAKEDAGRKVYSWWDCERYLCSDGEVTERVD